MQIDVITNFHKNPSFGLKIVKNQNYNTVVNYRKKHGESEKEIADSFEKISKLYNDNLSLEFCNPEEEFFDLLGVSALMADIRLKGFLQASDSNKQYEIDRLLGLKTPITSELPLMQSIKYLFQEEQKKLI